MTRNWTATTSPKPGRLNGVESHGDVVFAAGNRGQLLERVSPGDWQTVFRKGATGDGNNLRDVSFTDDGSRVWFTGDSGTFGYYDREAGTVEPHTAPDDYTSRFDTLTVDGASGSEHVYTADNSGRVVHAVADGSSVSVENADIPGDSKKITEIVEDGDLYAAKVDGTVLRSGSGETWEQERLTRTRIEALAVADTGVAALTGQGTLYRDLTVVDDDVEAREIRLNVHGVEELAAAGESYVAVGQDGAIAVLEGTGGVTYPDPEPGVTFYAAELLDDGTVLALGSEGRIVEGRPA